MIGKGSRCFFPLLQSRLKQVLSEIVSAANKEISQGKYLELKYLENRALGKLILKIWFGIFHFIILWGLCHCFVVILK